MRMTTRRLRKTKKTLSDRVAVVTCRILSSAMKVPLLPTPALQCTTIGRCSGLTRSLKARTNLGYAVTPILHTLYTTAHTTLQLHKTHWCILHTAYNSAQSRYQTKDTAPPFSLG